MIFFDLADIQRAIYMNQLLRKMTEQDLLDKLAELTSRLASGRGNDPAYEFCKMDIEEIQEEIELRKKTAPPGNDHMDGRH